MGQHAALTTALRGRVSGRAIIVIPQVPARVGIGAVPTCRLAVVVVAVTAAGARAVPVSRSGADRTALGLAGVRAAPTALLTVETTPKDPEG
jgi:hypothetical protein